MRTCSTVIVAASLLAATTAGAATLTLTPVVTQSYTLAFDPIEAFPDVSVPAGETRLYQVDFFIEISDLGPGQAGFGNMAFDVVLSNLTPVRRSRPSGSRASSRIPTVRCHQAPSASRTMATSVRPTTSRASSWASMRALPIRVMLATP